MNTAETLSKSTGSIHTKRLASVFIPLLLCYAGGAILSFLLSPVFFTDRYYISCPVPFVSVYGTLRTLAYCLKDTILQILLLLLAAFTLFPWWISTAAAVYRGICTGCALYAVSSSMVSGTGSAEAAVSMYFLASVILILLSAYAPVCAEALIRLHCHNDKRHTHALLFAYLRTFLVMSGGILAVTGFAILFC